MCPALACLSDDSAPACQRRRAGAFRCGRRSRLPSSSPSPAGRCKLNYMVKFSPLDRTFGALADPTRREILERLARGPASVSELAGPAGMSMPGLLKHVRILEQAQLVTTEKQGRVRQCRLDPGHLDDAAQWIQARRRWERRLDRLGAYLQRQTEREGAAL